MTEADSERDPTRSGGAELHPAICSAHDAAVARGDAGYLDPFSALFTFTAHYLADRGTCCDNGCRHCPYGDRPN